jgi:hypothetical protein
MSDTRASRFWAGVRRVLRAFVSSFLWLVVLTPILAVSAYSLYWVARHFGVPWYFAIAMSTCFDGVALLAADYSVKYAQAGLSGSWPRSVVRIFALTAAFLQTYHAKLGHEPTGGWVLWAALPIGAVTVYEIHIRWERRKALARSGSIYPAPLPSFGIVTWLLFPLSTLDKLRDIVHARRTALVRAANEVIAGFDRENQREMRKARADVAPPPPRTQPLTPDELEAHRRQREQRAQSSKAKPARPFTVGDIKVTAHNPSAHIRAWAKSVAGEYGWTIPDKSPLKREVHAAYRKAHGLDDDGNPIQPEAPVEPETSAESEPESEAQ